MAVTDKHIRAWATFLDTNADFLILFEADLVFKDDSNQRLENLLDKLVREKSDRLLYVDLAGGCSTEALKIGKLQIGKDATFLHYSKPVTNTACAYLLSRSLASTFFKVLIRRPWFRIIGVDWMMNALFMRMEKEAANFVVCMHAEPTIFKHGSTTGEYMPWVR
jgi:GR25 family glycosyltransferase involved in LPS biosynthesis